MGNKVIIVLVIFLACGIVYAWEIEDVNGTYVYDEEFLKSNRIYNEMYSWGRGRTMPNTSIDLDLEIKEVRLSGMGLYFIDTVIKDQDGSIGLKLFSVSDESRLSPLNMKMVFIDYRKVFITCFPQNGWWSRPLSPEEKWIWYRLSGPPAR